MAPQNASYDDTLSDVDKALIANQTKRENLDLLWIVPLVILAVIVYFVIVSVPLLVVGIQYPFSTDRRKERLLQWIKDNVLNPDLMLGRPSQ